MAVDNQVFSLKNKKIKTENAKQQYRKYQMNEKMLLNNVNSNQKMNYDYKNSINIIEYGSLPQIFDNNIQINNEK